MKKQLLTFVLAAAFFKLLFIPQYASAQNSRIWATYYGGHNDDHGNSVATDASGNVYMAGTTDSDSGIASRGFQNTFGGNSDAFLVKFNASGNRIWATYYGRQGGNSGNSVATDAAGNVYLAGSTEDTNHIALGGFLNTSIGGSAAFLVKFDSSGHRLWATYYYGADTNRVPATEGSSVATDAAGNVYLAGKTYDTTGIASPGGFQKTYGSGNVYGGDAFLVKFDANGKRLWATYYGDGVGAGFFAGTNVSGIVTDAGGNVYIAGTTSDHTGIASPGGFQDTLAGGQDAFVVKFDGAGNRLWATYYGGSGGNQFGNNYGNGIVSDDSGNVYLAGTTGDTGLASGGFQDILGGGMDAFLVKFDANGNRLWATYYGGEYDESGNGIATDASGNVYLEGVTASLDNIAFGGFQDTLAGGGQGANYFLVKFDASGNRLCATYYGPPEQTGQINEGSVALDNTGNVYLASTGVFDTTGIASGGFQNTYGGGTYDAVLIKFTSCTLIPPVANFQSSDSTFCSGQCINYTDLSTNATSWKWSFHGGTPSSSTIQNPQGICYDSAGTFNTTLIAFNSYYSDTLMSSFNFLKVLAAPPTPVITQHHDTLFCSTDTTYTSYQWYYDHTLIPGATDTFLVITHTGIYNYYNAEVSNGSCKISAGINILTDISPLSFGAGSGVRLFPNPAADELLISGNWKSETGKAKLTIFNIIGEIIYTEEISRQSEIINCKPFPAGIYFVRVENQNGRWVGRFVKE